MSQTTNNFVNRQSNNVNRRILKVEQVLKNELGEISELVVSVERGDTVDTVGTELNAESLTTIITNMIQEIKAKEV